MAAVRTDAPQVSGSVVLELVVVVREVDRQHAVQPENAAEVERAVGGAVDLVKHEGIRSANVLLVAQRYAAGEALQRCPVEDVLVTGGDGVLFDAAPERVQVDPVIEQLEEARAVDTGFHDRQAVALAGDSEPVDAAVHAVVDDASGSAHALRRVEEAILLAVDDQLGTASTDAAHIDARVVTQGFRDFGPIRLFRRLPIARWYGDRNGLRRGQ